MVRTKKVGLNVVFLILLFFFVSTVHATRNPSAVYCEEMGYVYKIVKTEQGEVGKCILPNGEEVDAWDFLKGKVAEQYSYCAKLGYEIKVVNDSEKCWRLKSDECAICVLPDGKEKEVTEVMRLDIEEGGCGNGVCEYSESYTICPSDCKPTIHDRETCVLDGFCNLTSENYLNCPEDCPTGIEDGICDKVKDNKVDPDCREGEDPDDTVIYEAKIAEKHGESDLIVYGIVLVVAVVASALVGGLYVLVRRIKR